MKNLKTWVKFNESIDSPDNDILNPRFTDKNAEEFLSRLGIDITTSEDGQNINVRKMSKGKILYGFKFEEDRDNLSNYLTERGIDFHRKGESIGAVYPYNVYIDSDVSEGKLMKAYNTKDNDVKIDEFRDKIKDYLKGLKYDIKKVGDDFEIHVNKKHVGQVMFRKDLITVKKVGVKFGKEFKYNEFGKVKAEIKNILN